VVAKLIDEGYEVYADFFGEESASQIATKHGKVDAVVTSNSFAHIDDMLDVMKGIAALLKEDGVLAIQVHYAVSMVEQMQYDWIYHEHLSYYTLFSLSNFLRRHGLEVFDARQTPMHGGSIRVFAQFKDGGKHELTESLQNLREKESALGVDRLSFFQKFAEKMDQTRIELRRTLSNLKVQGKKIVGYGAPARATTICGYVGLEFMKEHLSAVIDDSPAKQGAFMPGTHLPIVSSNILKRTNDHIPDYVLLFAWPWVRDIVIKNKKYINRGGALIIPLPEVKIVDKKTL